MLLGGHVGKSTNEEAIFANHNKFQGVKSKKFLALWVLCNLSKINKQKRKGNSLDYTGIGSFNLKIYKP